MYLPAHLGLWSTGVDGPDPLGAAWTDDRRAMECPVLRPGDGLPGVVIDTNEVDRCGNNLQIVGPLLEPPGRAGICQHILGIAAKQQRVEE